MLHVRLTLICSLLAVGHSAAVTDEAERTFSSGVQRVGLVELFTSEGCSSCPPADRWFSGLKADPGLWKDYVPVAFHVDYWDYIGWEDRFARTEYGDRHRRHALGGGARTVYTPGVFLQGQDWQEWRADRSPRRDEFEAGELRLTVKGNRVAIHFDDRQPGPGGLEVNLAILGMNLETSVRAGENNGRMLRHDFVALHVVSAPLEPGPSGVSATTTLPRTDADFDELAVVAWVSRTGSQTPVQSVGGYL